MATSQIGKTAQRTFETGRNIAQMAVWADSPVTQISTNLVILVAAMLSSVVTWGVGLVIAGFAMILLGVGIIRLLLQLWGG